MLQRQLSDRIEHYTSMLRGQCRCGQSFVKVLGSDCTTLVNGDRYHYPENNTATCVFRCKVCHKPIHENFKALGKEVSND